MLFIGQRSHNVPFFHRNVPWQSCFLQELVAKLEAMNKTAMEKLSTLMETSEADRKQKKTAKFWQKYDLITCTLSWPPLN